MTAPGEPGTPRTTGPTVLVLRHARVVSPSARVPINPNDSEPCELSAALRKAWPTDAHVVGYAPNPITSTEGTVFHPRMSREGVGDPAMGVVRMLAMIGDVDPPGHVATPEWRAMIRPRLDACGAAWYETRNGCRIVATLPHAFGINSVADEAEWYRQILGWREYLLEAHGVEIDETCKDWTRLYRLPNVIRDGKPQRSRLRGRLRPWLAEEWLPPAVTAPPSRATGTATPPTATDDLALARAVAVAEAMPSSVEGLGGDECLMRCAREVASHAGEDADVIECVLAEVFNPRCLPPWPAAKLRYEADRACAAIATPEARYARRVAARDLEACTAAAAVEAAYSIQEGQADPWHTAYDWGSPDVPIPYLCEGLRLAPSRGKVSLIAGLYGAGKGPIADHIAACFALGHPIFGVHAVTRSRVILLDCEGLALTTRRIRRMVRSLGCQPTELQDWLTPIDASTLGDMSAVSNLLALEERVRELGVDVIVLDSYTTAMLSSGADPMSPEFAKLAQLLGRLGKLVICVAHANKQVGQNDEPSLSDIAYSGAVAALAQTALVTYYPNAADKYLVRVACARAPETRFAPFDLRFADEPDGSLSVKVATPGMALPDAIPAGRLRAAATVNDHADRIEALLTTGDETGQGMTSRKIRQHLAIPPRDWAPVLDELLKRRAVITTTHPGQAGVTIRANLQTRTKP